MRHAIIRSAAMGTALALSGSACGANTAPMPLQTLTTTTVGTVGNRLTIEDTFTPADTVAITAGIAAIRVAGGCSIDLVVRDLNKHPDLADVDGKRAAGRGFAGGILYLASDIQESEDISIKRLAAHEGLHACVTEVRTTDLIQVARTDFKGGSISGFDIRASVGTKTASVLDFDEAGVEWLAEQATPGEVSKDTGYGHITDIFGSLAIRAKNGFTAQKVETLHARSDIAGMTELITGREPTEKSVGCVAGQFFLVHNQGFDPAAAQEAIQAC